MELFSTKGLGLATAMATGLAVPAIGRNGTDDVLPDCCGWGID